MIVRESKEEVLELGTIFRRGSLEAEAEFRIDLIGSDDAVVLCEFPNMEVCCAPCVDDDKCSLVKGPVPMPVSDDTANVDVHPPGSKGLANVFGIECSISFGLVSAYSYVEQAPSQRLLWVRRGLNEGCENNAFSRSRKSNKRQQAVCFREKSTLKLRGQSPAMRIRQSSATKSMNAMVNRNYVIELLQKLEAAESIGGLAVLTIASLLNATNIASHLEKMAMCSIMRRKRIS